MIIFFRFYIYIIFFIIIVIGLTNKNAAAAVAINYTEGRRCTGKVGNDEGTSRVKFYRVTSNNVRFR